MTAPTPDEAAATVERLTQRPKGGVVWSPKELADRALAAGYRAACAERDSLRARLAAQQPVIDAAETWERQRYGRGPWPEGTERWPQVEKRLRDAVRANRAALSGSVEAADTPPSGTSGHEAYTPAEPEWEVYVTATGSPTGATYDEFGDAQVHVEALNELSGKRRYDIRRAKSREAADTPPSGTSGHEAYTPAEPERCPRCLHLRDVHSVRGCDFDGCSCDRTRREVDMERRPLPQLAYTRAGSARPPDDVRLYRYSERLKGWLVDQGWEYIGELPEGASPLTAREVAGTPAAEPDEQLAAGLTDLAYSGCGLGGATVGMLHAAAARLRTLATPNKD